MALFKQSTVDAEKKFDAINAFKADVYNASVVAVEVVEVDDTNWDSGHPVKNPDIKVDNVRVTLDIESTVDGSPIIGVDGNPPTFTSLSFWFDPTRTGMSKKGPSKARVLITTLMDWDIKEKINLMVLEDLISNGKLIEKKIRCAVSVTEAGKNRIDNFMPAKK